MSICFYPVNKDNWLEVGRLKVRPDQEHFVAANFVSIAESKFEPELIPMVIMHDNEMVGFLMYGYDRDQDSYWIIRFMIDQRFQGKGYGRQAIQMAVAMLRAIPGYKRVKLSYELENAPAEKLYASIGFVPTGEIEQGEKVVVLEG